MKKAIVLGIVLAMVMGLSVAASADFVPDLDQNISLVFSNGTFTAGTWGSGAATQKDGVSATPGATSAGSAPTTGQAFIRNLNGGANGYNTDMKTAFATQTDAAQVLSWDLAMGVGSVYTPTSLKLKAWGTGIDFANPGSYFKLEVLTVSKAGLGLEAGQVLFDNSGATQCLNGTAGTNTVGFTLDLSQYIAAWKGTTYAAPGATLRLSLVTPAGVVTPEPGSMLAMFSGLVGLVGFGIRRRR